MPSSSRKLLSTDSERWRLAREDLHIRNTTEAKHDVAIKIYNEGECCHTAHYRLLPDQSGCSVNLLQDGCYKIRAVLDQQYESVGAVTVTSEPEQTAFIRIQNNEIMIEEGVPPRL